MVRSADVNVGPDVEGEREVACLGCWTFVKKSAEAHEQAIVSRRGYMVE
jgi:hypothetical protein